MNAYKVNLSRIFVRFFNECLCIYIEGWAVTKIAQRVMEFYKD